MNPDEHTSTRTLLLDAEEAAALLRIHPQTLRRLVREHRAPVQARHVGRCLRFSRVEIERYAGVNG